MITVCGGRGGFQDWVTSQFQKVQDAMVSSPKILFGFSCFAKLRNLELRSESGCREAVVSLVQVWLRTGSVCFGVCLSLFFLEVLLMCGRC